MNTIFSFLQMGFSAIIPFILLLGILVFVHEMGHFMVARWCGVKVETFSMGFGKKLFQYKKGDTVYALSLIPLGGYVKMFGEQPGSDIPEDQKAVSFTHKTVWQRIAIVLAGPAMNFFFAIFIFTIVAFIGEETKAPVAGDIAESSYAYSLGLRSGDTIAMVNQTEIKTWDQFQKILNKFKQQSVELKISRTESGVSSEQKLNANVITKENPNPLSTESTIGEIDGLSTMSKASVIALKEDSPLVRLGLKNGDVIDTINSIPVGKWRDLEKTLTSIPKDQNLDIQVTRYKNTKDEPEKISLLMIPTSQDYNLANLGIESSELYIGSVLKESPAEKAGLKEGDKIISIGGVQIIQWDDVIVNVKKFNGTDPLEIVTLRSGELKNFKISPQITSITTSMGAEEKRFAIGISPLLGVSMPALVVSKESSLAPAITRAVTKTWDVSVMTLLGFVRLFEGKISHKHIGGVISIGQAASETFKVGIGQFLQMMAIVSVNLFILNLLPVPVLDGGHLVFYTMEIINRGPVSLRKMEIAQQVGMILLLSLMVFALFNDFSRLLGFQ